MRSVREGLRLARLALTLNLLALVLATATLSPAPAAEARGASAARVRFPLPRDDGTLTPYSFDLGYPLVALIYDTVMWRDAGGVPRPWLARSVEASAGGRLVTIRLRSGVRWQDGRPLTASDVAFTFRFVASHPHSRFTPEVSAVQGVSVRDAHTVVIRLRHPSLGFLDQPLADLPILPAHIWSHLPRGRLSPRGLALGSGPYRLVAHSRGRFYRFQANPHYFLGAPRVGRLDVPIIRNFERALAALDQRLIDMLPVGLPRDAVQRLQAGDAAIRTGPAYAGTVLMFNLRRAPFADVAARRAVADALDLGRIARAVGSATPAEHGYLHPASRWASPGVLHRVNASGARAALARLGLRRLRILASDSDPVRREAGRQVVLALRRAGVRATLTALGPQELAKAVGANGARPTFDAAVWSSLPLASYDPDFLSRVFGSSPAEAALNYSGYRSQAFQDLAAQVAASPDARARRRAVEQELRLLASDVPVVPLLFADGAFGYRPKVYDGWVYVKGTGILDKRSFLGAAGQQSQSRSGKGPDAVLVVGLVAVGLLGVGGTVGLVKQRRRRASR